MDSKQTRSVLIAMAGIVLIWILSPLAGFRQASISLSTAPLSFDASCAHRTIEEFVTECPNRALGSFESRHASGYLSDRLESMGYEPGYMQFGSRIARRKEVGRNVLAYKAGSSPEIIAVVAHYDTAKTTEQGAMDNGSGVGVLMEIARILAAVPTNRSILIVFSDGGEWGMLGAMDLATRYDERSRIAAVLSLDYVAIGDLAALSLDEAGMMKGFTPPWYRVLALQAAEEQGLPVLSSSGIREHMARAFYIPWTDQGPFLQAGIPAINLGSRSVDRAGEKAVYHSTLDTIENLKATGIERFGYAAERIVRTLDELPSIPVESMQSFRLWHDLFLGPYLIRFLHGIVFIPLLLCLCFHFRNHSRSLKLAEAGRELIAFLATLFPFLTLYLLIGLFRALRKLPSFSLYPATAGDTVLEAPAWDIIGWIFGTAGIIGALCIFFYIVAFRNHPRQNFNVSKHVLLGLLTITAILALLYNSYWAVAFLALPGWIWGLLGRSRSRISRILAWIWIPAAGLPCLALLFMLASRFGMSLNLIWYQILALNSGLFTSSGFFLGTATLAIGIRFWIIQLHREDIETEGAG